MSTRAIVRPVEQPAQFQYMIFCPGCKCGHGFRVGQSDAPNWTFNYNMERPTFTPSYLTEYYKWPERDPATGDWKRGPDGQYLLGPDGKLLGGKAMVCHSFVIDGRIQFLPDCTHELAGQTVPLEPF